MNRSYEKWLAWQRRSKKLSRGKSRLRPQGRRGKRRMGTDVFGPLAEMVRMLNCDLCGESGPSDPHHVRTRGAGFGDWIDGRGNLVALCRPCHRSAPSHKSEAGQALAARAELHGEAFHRITKGRYRQERKGAA